MTVSAQQIHLMQAQGLPNLNPQKLFLTDLITQIKQWRQANKEVVLCIDANKPVDDLCSDISRLFTETDMINLHHHCHPALNKPATHQRGSQAIDLIAGSPLVASALLHAWIHPFGDPVSIKGDHRLLGIDLDPEILFGTADLPPHHVQTRGTNSRHPQKVTKFCKRVVDQCNQYRLAERIAMLQTLPRLETHHQAELKDIDERLTKILLQADRACTPPQESSWSPKLNQAYLRHRLWNLELTAHQTKRDLSTAINLIRQQLQPSPLDALELTRSLSVNLRNAQKALRAAQKAADTLRQQHLEAVLNDARAANQGKKSQALTNLIRAEQNRCCYSAFRQTTKPKSQGGLAYITVPDGNNSPTTILDKDDMNLTLLEYSRTHVATAQGTPFTVEPLNHLLHYDGLTLFGDRILQGRVELEELPIDDATRALLYNMRDKTKPHDDRTHPLIYDDLQNGIKKWPEKTSTSPSGRHLGIYKSLQKHVLTKEALEALPPTQSATPLKQGWDVLFLIFDIMSLALLHTYTLNRWKTVWTLFIEKELGNPDLNRLRCIMIFEADWQLLLKWHSSYGFLSKSESAHTLTPVQGGGRKGCSAIDQATQQIIETELIKLNQRSAMDMYLDARWCFDLMVEACHNMACRRHGAADDYLRLHAQTHRTMKYYVRHKYGVSEDYNTFEQHPWHGAGQGAADAALRYIALSDSLIDAYHSKIQQWAIKDPTVTLTVFKSMKAFIDDVAMSVGGDQLSFETLVQQAETQLQWWTQLIQASGGALNPTKCCCALYTWIPDAAGILCFDTSVTRDINIAPCPQQPQQTIQVLQPNEGTRYLGIYITRTGDTKPMQDHIWRKALLYTKAFQ